MDSMKMNMNKVVESINGFAGRMMRTEKMPMMENMMISPFSLWTALIMTLCGADGETRKEMLNALMPGMEDSDDMRAAYRALMEMIKDDRMLSVNAVFHVPDVRMMARFREMMMATYGAAACELPPKPEDACMAINKFMSDNTKGMIRDMMDLRSMEEMRLMLASAVYFKSMWATAFDRAETKMAPFSMLDQKACVDVRMMSVEGCFRMMRNEMVQMIEIPYDGEKFVMNIAMPMQNTMEAWRLMTKGDIRFPNMRDMPTMQIRLSMPSFAMNYKNDFVPHLQEMGIKMAFTEKADFSRMMEGSASMSAVMHNAMMEIDEDGTTAGAGTISKMVSSVMGKTEEFRVDRPFAFCIKHAETNAVMFMGQVVSPPPVVPSM